MTQNLPSGTPDDRTPNGPQAPPAGWAPAPLSDGGRPSVGRATRPQPVAGDPLGTSGLPAVTIDEFAPPRSRLPLVVVAVALVAAALIWAGTTWRAQSGPTAEGSPSARPTATSSAPGLPFVTPDERFTGRWEILQHQWTDSGLEVEIRVAAERGPITYSFAAFGNNDMQSTSASPGSQNPKFTGLPIASGRDETGWLFFPLERGPSTIILATASGNQMSALPVAG